VIHNHLVDTGRIPSHDDVASLLSRPASDDPIAPGPIEGEPVEAPIPDEPLLSTTTKIKRGRNKLKRKGGDVFVAGKFNRAKNEITLDEAAIAEGFDGKVWLNPAKGVRPLPEDMINTVGDWERFVTNHELAHADFPRNKGESKADYENRINDIATEAFNRGGGSDLPPSATGDLLDGGPPRGGDTVASAGGLEDILAKVNPGLQVLLSTHAHANNIIERMAEFGGFHKKNLKGTDKATKQAVETKIKRHGSALASFITGLRDNYGAYRARVTGEPEAKGLFGTVAQSAKDAIRREGRKTLEERDFMLPDEFNRSVTASLRRPDMEVEPEVRAMAQKIRAKLDADAELGILHGLIQSEDKLANWVPRIWHIHTVRERMDELVDLIHADQISRVGDAAKKKSEIRLQLERILHTADGMEDVDLDAIKTSPKGIFKERTIDVSDEVVEEFLESDIDVILRTYNRQFAADIELTKEFGDVGMTRDIDQLKFEAQATIKAAATPELKAKLVDQLALDLKNIRAMRDLLRGNYGLPADPFSMTSKTARLVTDFSHLTMLGGVVISSLPDMGRIVMANGIENAFPMLKLIVSDIKTWKIAAEEAKMAGTGLDMILQSRALAMVNASELPQRFTRIEEISGRATNAFFIANLLSPWNAFLKQAAGVVISNRIARDTIRTVEGMVTESGAARLRAAGISVEDAKLIAAQIQQHGEVVQDTWIPNTLEWDADAAGLVDTFRNALVRDIDATIVTPGVGDQPLFSHAGFQVLDEDTTKNWPGIFLHPSWGKMITMYKSFVFASATRVLLPGIQIRDAATLHGAMMMTYIGALVVSLKDKMNGRPGTDSVTGFLLDGIDQSGITSWFATVNNIIESITDNEIGLRPVTGTAPPWSTTLTWKAGSVFGPVASIAGRTAGIGKDILLGDMDYHTGLDVWRSVPGNNLFWLKMGNVTRMGDWMDQLAEEGGAALSLGNRNLF